GGFELFGLGLLLHCAKLCGHVGLGAAEITLGGFEVGTQVANIVAHVADFSLDLAQALGGFDLFGLGLLLHCAELCGHVGLGAAEVTLGCFEVVTHVAHVGAHFAAFPPRRSSALGGFELFGLGLLLHCAELCGHVGLGAAEVTLGGFEV